MISNESEYIYITPEYEYLLKKIFGQKKHGFAGTKRTCSWKSSVLEQIEAIRKSVVYNVQTSDNDHLREMQSICDKYSNSISKMSSKDMMNLKLIEFQTIMIFTLLGRLPDNSAKKRLHHNNSLRLDKYRTLNYSNSNKQKVNLIMSKNRVWEDKYLEDFKSDDTKFLEWFKKEHSEVYLELF